MVCTFPQEPPVPSQSTPEIPRAAELKARYAVNKDLINELITDTASSSTAKVIPPLKKDIATPIAEIPSLLSKRSTFWVYATTEIMDTHQQLCYTACNNCTRAVYAQVGLYMHRLHKDCTCTKCNNEESIAEPRCRFEIVLTDQTGSMVATIYGKTAEEHFGFTASQLITDTEHTGSKRYLIQLKHAKYTIREEEHQKFNISTIQRPIPDVDAGTSLETNKLPSNGKNESTPTKHQTSSSDAQRPQVI